jgi:hypothetical protein
MARLLGRRDLSVNYYEQALENARLCSVIHPDVISNILSRGLSHYVSSF